MESKVKLNSDQCYILVADDIKTIFYWIGGRTSVRVRFIGLKKCREISNQFEEHYKIITLGEGDEDPEFNRLFGGNRGPGAPFPYIPNPPRPPDDLDEANQIQLLRMKPPDESEFIRFCKYCGAPLDESVSVCPNCKKKN